MRTTKKPRWKLTKTAIAKRQRKKSRRLEYLLDTERFEQALDEGLILRIGKTQKCLTNQLSMLRNRNSSRN